MGAHNAIKNIKKKETQVIVEQEDQYVHAYIAA
jgi:hypothetical protein